MWLNIGPTMMPRDTESAAMDIRPDLSIIPGRRIEHYRNSSQRHVKLYGLGQAGAKIARTVSERGYPNVAVDAGNRPVDWSDIAGGASAAETNMFVVVCAEGDQALFRPRSERPAPLVTFVLLQEGDGGPMLADGALPNIRAYCDLFVTTSDVDYVGDLIDNLAS
jgi:hypothetical protein